MVCCGCFAEPGGIGRAPTTGVGEAGSSSTGTDQGGTTSRTDGDRTTSGEAAATVTSPQTGEGSTESGGGAEAPPPVAAWLFDGGTVDVSGGGFDGVVVGTVLFDASPDGLALRLQGRATSTCHRLPTCIDRASMPSRCQRSFVLTAGLPHVAPYSLSALRSLRPPTTRSSFGSLLKLPNSTESPAVATRSFPSSARHRRRINGIAAGSWSMAVS